MNALLDGVEGAPAIEDSKASLTCNSNDPSADRRLVRSHGDAPASDLGSGVGHG